MSSSSDLTFDLCSAGADFSTADGIKDVLRCVSAGTQQALEEETRNLANGVDAFYLIFAGSLVYFMQTGFAMLCAGSIRSKNVMNVILWNLLDSCGGGLAFWAVGYAFAYGGDDDGPKTFVGTRGFFLKGDDIQFENWFFQFAFACALSSIVAGTIAERTQMKAYLLYSVFLAGFCYPVVAHAWWSTNGFLSSGATDPLFNSGAIDLAGSGPVHMTGGVTALVAAIILGPRKGRFYDAKGEPLDEPVTFAPHSVALQFLGTFCLWFGWYGFNPGSVLFVSSRGDVAALVAVNTTLSACAGAVSAMFFSTWYDWYRTGEHTYDLGYTMNGCLTGLVAVTAGCATIDTWAAVLVGIGAGFFYLCGSKLLIRLRIDDAVDAIPVHMVGGAWGVVATGLLSRADLMVAAGLGNPEHVGWFYEWGRGSGDFTLMGAQLVGLLFILGWVSAVMGCYFGFLSWMGWLRIDPLEEEIGMDLSRHKGSAYTIEDVDRAKVEQLHEDRSNHSGSRRMSGAVKKEEPAEVGADVEA